jgi:hypothetical protein
MDSSISYPPDKGLCGCERPISHSPARPECENLRCSDETGEKGVSPFNNPSERHRRFSRGYSILPKGYPNITTRTKQVLLLLGLATLSLLYLCPRFFGHLPFTACKLSTSCLRLFHAPTATPPLEVFQVCQPVPTPSHWPSDGSGDIAGAPASDGTDCVHTSVLMDHVFAFSYGHPFVG